MNGKIHPSGIVSWCILFARYVSLSIAYARVSVIRAESTRYKLNDKAIERAWATHLMPHSGEVFLYPVN
jgi:hypothetical protein